MPAGPTPVPVSEADADQVLLLDGDGDSNSGTLLLEGDGLYEVSRDGLIGTEDSRSSLLELEPLITTTSVLYADDSRGRLRHFIVDGKHPDSSTELIEHPKAPLRNGNPFPFVIAIIPAFNEQDSIVRTLMSLRAQTYRADEIIVLADNCTDETVALALIAGVSVVESVGNAGGKAGALNALLAQILPILDHEDCILVMDADTELSERFIESTVIALYGDSSRPIAGVGGIFLADHEDEWNLVRQLQSNEYVRYQRRLSRRRGRALVLTGTGTVFKAGVLLQVQEARKTGRLPDLGMTRSVYDTSALTEDNELTLSIKELGYRAISPHGSTVTTAMMPDLASLYKQRRRWQRGALENLVAHGLNPTTAPYMIRQFLTYLGVIFLPFYIHTLTLSVVNHDAPSFVQPLWITVAVIYVFEQTLSVRRGGWKAILVSLAVLPELFLNTFLNVVYLGCYYGALFATDEAWGRVRHLSATEYDKRGNPLVKVLKVAKLTLHGTHRSRHTAGHRSLQVVLATLTVGVMVAAVIIPFVDILLAWNVIAVYVLAGFLATLGRLVPVRIS